jgi:hypothetical protein
VEISLNLIIIKKKIIVKKVFTFLTLTFFCTLNIDAHADTPTTPSGLDSVKSNVDTLNSTTSTAKETSKNISELSSKNADSNDDPKGKAAPATPPKGIPSQKPGGIFDRIFGRICSVQVNIQKEANNNSAILSELVIIYKAELFSQISSMTIKDWFTLNTQAIKTLRSSKDVQIYRFELTPDSAYTSYLIDLNSGAVGAFLFNRLTNNLNSFPIQLNPYKNLKVSFFSLGFNYSQESEK